MNDPVNVLNQALVATAKTMYKEGFITEEQYIYFVRNYYMISWQPSRWDRLRRKLRKEKYKTGSFANDTTMYDVVKLIHPDNNEEDLELSELRKYRQEELMQQQGGPKKKSQTTRFEEIAGDE